MDRQELEQHVKTLQSVRDRATDLLREHAGADPDPEHVIGMVLDLAGVLQAMLDAKILRREHENAVHQEIKTSIHQEPITAGQPVGEAPKVGQEGTAGAKKGGPGWPEVERSKGFMDKFTTEPDPRD